MRPLEAVRDVASGLAEAGVPSPRVDAEHLVAHVLGSTRTALYSAEGELSDEEVRLLGSVTARRRRREPLAYILGEWGFRRLTLAVDERVLVPRPETEIVVERCLALLAGVREPRILDVGVGSGAIALALADEGVLDELGVELIGAGVEAIRRAEDRERFREAVRSVGLRVPTSWIVTRVDELVDVVLPAVVRP